MSYFEELYAVNVNGKTEERNGLTYLSWANAIAEVLKRYPNMTYRVVRNPETGAPYFYDPETGYMVFTEVTIEGVTREMWLPVMDSANNAMLAKPYTKTNKYGKETAVAAATMFDINKTIMRCLTKNLGMFGLGLYIYAGEDLPEAEVEQKKSDDKAKAAALLEEQKKLLTLAKKDGITQEWLCNLYGKKKITDFTDTAIQNANANWEKIKERFANETKGEVKGTAT